MRTIRSRLDLPALLIVSGILLFLGLALAFSFTRAPWWDEGFIAGPSLNLASSGVFGSHTLSNYIPSGDRYMYWNMPLYLLAVTAWFKAFGFGVVAMRMVSILCALLVFAAWYVIAVCLTEDRVSAALTIFLLSFDYVFILGAANGRMDMMTAMCGLLGLAAYLHFRQSRLNRAILLGACGSTAALFCHPLGLIYAGLLTFTILFLDWRRIRWVHVLLAVIPLSVAAGCWLLYISQAPHIFAEQMNIYSRRLHPIWNPVKLIRRETTGRYLMYYYKPGATGVANFKVLSLGLYLAGLLLALGARGLRMSPKGRLLICLAPLSALLLAFGDIVQFPQYFLHIFPFYVALLAAASVYFFRQARLRPLVLLLFVVSFLVNAGGLLVKVRRNEFRTVYNPVIAHIRPLLGPGTQVDGPCELIFGLGDAHVTDGLAYDRYLARRPEFIVIGSHFGFARLYEPERYTSVFKNSEYVVYQERQPNRQSTIGVDGSDKARVSLPAVSVMTQYASPGH